MSASLRRPAIFGEVLYDRFPDQTVLGGAPFNVAWHLQAFGQKPLFISRVGEDELGDGILQAMADWGMDSSSVQRDSQHATGTVEIQLLESGHRFEIVDRCAYDYIDGETLPELDDSALLYQGTLALRHPDCRRTFDRLKSNSPVFLDVNLRSPWWRAEQVQAWIRQARWLKLNEDELRLLTEHNGDLKAMACALRLEAQLDLVIVTCGENGAFAVDDAGGVHEIQPAGQPVVVDTVGAGDAFASVVILGLLHNWPLPLMLTRAQQFASAIVSRRGAVVRQPDFYLPFHSNWDLDKSCIHYSNR